MFSGAQPRVMRHAPTPERQHLTRSALALRTRTAPRLVAQTAPPTIRIWRWSSAWQGAASAARGGAYRLLELVCVMLERGAAHPAENDPDQTECCAADPADVHTWIGEVTARQDRDTYQTQEDG